VEPVTPQDEHDHYGPPFSLARLEMLAGVLSAEDLRHFAQMYLQHSVTCARRIASLAAEGDYDAMGQETHQFVGSAGNAGAMETYRLARALETAAKAGDQTACQRLALLLPPATERAASWLRAWMAEPRQDARNLLEL
jgi:HPt (histidine-containing phosphotransfer) domain-containing protein